MMTLADEFAAALATDAKTSVKTRLRSHRMTLLNAWLAGGTPDGSPRWAGDDGRVLDLAEYPFWPAALQAAEQAKFAALDAAYETAKTAAGVK